MVETIMMTLSALAERDGVSRQAISKTVRDLIDRHPDIPVERDGRGRIAKVSTAHLDHYRERYQNPARVLASRPAAADAVRSQVSPPPMAKEDSFDEARRLNEWLRYSREKLKHEEDCGRLVVADSVGQAHDAIGREIQAIVSRLPNRADDLALAVTKEGVHGLRVLLREVAFDLNVAIAERLAAIANEAPETETFDTGEGDDADAPAP